MWIESLIQVCLKLSDVRLKDLFWVDGFTIQYNIATQLINKNIIIKKLQLLLFYDFCFFMKLTRNVENRYVDVLM